MRRSLFAFGCCATLAALRVPAPAAEVVETGRDFEEARIWAELPRGEHLLKAHTEEAQRRARSERLVRLEESRARAHNPVTFHGSEIERILATVCAHRGRSPLSVKSLLHNNYR